MNGIPDVALAQLKFLFGCPEEECLCDDADVMMLNNVPAKLSGLKSRELF